MGKWQHSFLVFSFAKINVYHVCVCAVAGAGADAAIAHSFFFISLSLKIVCVQSKKSSLVEEKNCVRSEAVKSIWN